MSLLRAPKRIDPIRDIGGRLLDVEKPARYLGGEYGSSIKNDSSSSGRGYFDIALSFPDLYEIGMSNNAIRILYDGLNRIPEVRCERVFAPAPDFEALLAELGLPLYTLETGLALEDVDLIGFSFGYELAATNLLAVLSSGKVPLLAAERGEGDPIVIAGGPAITNPHPFADFLDAAYIGEAESTFFGLAADLAKLKSTGASRSELLGRLAEEQAIWMPSRPGQDGQSSHDGKKALRAVFSGFSEATYGIASPIPTVKTVQDHGTVEIMRGCPNGCRFCHAGYFYRPQRAKSFSAIDAEVEGLVREGGHREITLSSLSSGDYPQLPELLTALNAKWSSRRVSFQLPSLKVNSFTLPLIAQLSEVRKSGLTFAVETPVDEWQRLINKDVSFERTVAILEEARSCGFKQAKFYFMIGLPVPTARGIGEVDAIIEYFGRLFERVRMQINVNVGTFVPKPHTPFQWSAQLSETEALEAVNALRSGLRRYKNIKLSYHSPFVSLLEGVIARGDERVGGLLLEAFKRGARLDAWDEHFDRELWRAVFNDAGWDVVGQCCQARDLDAPLIWDDVSVRVPKAVFKSEYEHAQQEEFTDACANNCTHPCGVCSSETGIVLNSAHTQEEIAVIPFEKRAILGRFIFSFVKEGVARYFQNLSIIDSFEKAFLMENMSVAFSDGFNPMPRIEITQPLPIAFGSDSEMASILMEERIDEATFVARLNRRLPTGLRVLEARWYPVEPGVRQRSIGSMSWGAVYRIEGGEGDLFSKISSSLERLLLPTATVSVRDLGDGKSAILLKLPDPAVKEMSLVKILETCIEARPVQRTLTISREACLADIGSGPVSYFDAYDKVSQHCSESRS